MAIKERKQITGTEAQIKSYAGHNGVLAYATDTKHLHVFSGTAGTTTELANVSDIPAISGKADTTYVNAELAKRAPASHTHTTAQVTGLDTALAGKAPKSHTHTIANVTNLQTALDAKTNDATLQVDLTAIRESIANVSSKVDGIGDTLSPTYAKKQGILDACDKALYGANPVHAGDPALDEIKSSLATIQAQLGQLESRRYVKETGKSSDGTSWYRKWSDGWIEQGGITQSTRGATSRTIKLRPPFSSSNYVVVVQSYTGGSHENKHNNFHVETKSISSFSTVAGCVEDISCLWYACGY